MRNDDQFLARDLSRIDFREGLSQEQATKKHEGVKP